MHENPVVIAQLFETELCSTSVNYESSTCAQ